MGPSEHIGNAMSGEADVVVQVGHLYGCVHTTTAGDPAARLRQSEPRPLHVLVVDDAEDDQEHLAALLHADARVGTVGRAGDGAEALRYSRDVVRRNDVVDLWILDVLMPGLDGIALGRAAACFRPAPRVIIASSSQEFALDAFDVEALDYLVKPVTAERLAEALRRACTG